MGFQADEIRDKARGHWAGILAKLGASPQLLDNRHSQCPALGNCPGNDGESGNGGSRRFRFDDEGGDGTWICSGRYAGKGLDLVMHIKGCDFPTACELVGTELGLVRRGGPSATKKSEPGETVAPEPAIDPDERKAQAFDIELLRRYYRPEWGIDESWLFDKSPILPHSDSAAFLDALYRPGERVLVFTKFQSQGQFMHWVGKGSYRLGGRPGIKAEPARLPTRSDDGAWFLGQPVSGEWKSKIKGGEQPKMSRRMGDCVTRWPYLVLESDEAPDELWLSFLVQLPVPIVAIYTSAARSIHALIRMDAPSKAAWDEVRAVVLPLFSKFGGDPGALTAVRLTRLPGVQRRILHCPECGAVKGFAPKGGKCSCGAYIAPERAEWREQRLLYLNPKAPERQRLIHQ